jgi:hypothetical protein
MQVAASHENRWVDSLPIHWIADFPFHCPFAFERIGRRVLEHPKAVRPVCVGINRDEKKDFRNRSPLIVFRASSLRETPRSESCPGAVPKGWASAQECMPFGSGTQLPGHKGLAQ